MTGVECVSFPSLATHLMFFPVFGSKSAGKFRSAETILRDQACPHCGWSAAVASHVVHARALRRRIIGATIIGRSPGVTLVPVGANRPPTIQLEARTSNTNTVHRKTGSSGQTRSLRISGHGLGSAADVRARRMDS